MKSKEFLWKNIQKIASEISDSHEHDPIIFETKIQQLYEDFIILKNIRNDSEIENNETLVSKSEFSEVKIESSKSKKGEISLVTNTPKHQKHHPIPLNINDKFALLSQLFNNDSEALHHTIEALNLSENRQDSLLLLKLLKQKYNWNDLHQEYIERLEELIDKRFDA